MDSIGGGGGGGGGGGVVVVIVVVVVIGTSRTCNSNKTLARAHNMQYPVP